MTSEERNVRLAGLTSWHADWRGLRVAVFGLGATGFSVADTLVELGAEVLVVAETADPDRGRLLDVIGARFVLGGAGGPPEELLAFSADLVVVSPGYPPHHALVTWASEAGLPLWGDIELAWRVRDKAGTPAEWLLVTGTNGKTTTVQMTASMLVTAGLRAAPCGNIGVPVLDAVRDPGGFDVFVVELSSHQLHYLARQSTPEPVSPLASVCLNLSDDHLEWHGSAEAYRDAKAGVYANTRVACVYNRADPATRRMVEEAEVVAGARAIGFGLDVPGPSDLGIVDGILCDRAFLDDRFSSALEITTIDALAEQGLAAPHVVANILAASALVRAVGVTPEQIRDTLAAFSLDHHRIETIAVADGITWVDDSKATNAHAADASLSAYPSVVWIVGGLLKGIDIAALVAKHADRVRAAVVIGRDREAVTAAFERHAPGVPVIEVSPADTGEVMPQAVEAASGIAAAGDTVLLAPAAASMDQFTDYAQRGRLFASAVADLVGGDADERPTPSRPGSD
ncbi:UDP-N-acetylmuramoyl-L-alanine--D-glutamate ligase [Labedella endophytica]|uniref:UDP-N-acetylmuramoylalanine--D-glutamate ligase n=1 Tax=Labedella endophytica TaxID=1523160 RepID=A0A3S0XAL0_9MICO|nr:UDP-N-acetylmuramoyl-L-alanine--D-glutamate ligase [Labedella endophytica]RUR00818.1 UDP-N-acetylmuramoyl-L-alanine--D-glutamate ligase [Labedella endophytica]